MDPDTCWKQIAECMKDAYFEQARNLLQWLEKGGFPPKITEERIFDLLVAKATCKAITDWKL